MKKNNNTHDIHPFQVNFMKSRLFQSFGHVVMVVHAGVALRYALQVHLILIMFSARACSSLRLDRRGGGKSRAGNGWPMPFEESIRATVRLLLMYVCGNARRRGLVRLLDS